MRKPGRFRRTKRSKEGSTLMEEYMQFSAKNKNEAITKACIELGTTSDELDIMVISEGTTGFLDLEPSRL